MLPDRDDTEEEQRGHPVTEEQMEQEDHGSQAADSQGGDLVEVPAHEGEPEISLETQQSHAQEVDGLRTNAYMQQDEKLDDAPPAGDGDQPTGEVIGRSPPSALHEPIVMPDGATPVAPGVASTVPSGLPDRESSDRATSELCNPWEVTEGDNMNGEDGPPLPHPLTLRRPMTIPAPCPAAKPSISYILGRTARWFIMTSNECMMDYFSGGCCMDG